MRRTFNKAKLMNHLAVIVSVVILASCAPGNAGNDDGDGKSKQVQLAEYKQQAHELKLKIDELEKEIKASAKVEYTEVVVSDIVPRKFEHFIEVTGKVEADAEIDISPESSGQILEIRVKEGQQVAKGTVLATMNTGPIDRTIEQTEVNLQMAETTFERQKNLWEQNIGSEMQFLQAKSNKEALEKQLENLQSQKDMSIIKAPLDGIIDVIYQKKGQIAGPQAPFARLVNLDKIKVYADVAEPYLTKIKKGDEVFVSFPAIDQNRVTTVQMIGNYIDPNNRTFRIRLDIQNKGNLIKPNMDAVVKLRDYAAEDALVIPSLLVKEDFKGQYTFIAESSDSGTLTAKKVYIKTGVSDNNMTEVQEGLTPGMKIISSGFSQVVDGSAIKAN
jgi:RND family efflux transporter MFP subunit